MEKDLFVKKLKEMLSELNPELDDVETQCITLFTLAVACSDPVLRQMSYLHSQEFSNIAKAYCDAKAQVLEEHLLTKKVKIEN